MKKLKLTGRFYDQMTKHQKDRVEYVYGLLERRREDLLKVNKNNFNNIVFSIAKDVVCDEVCCNIIPKKNRTNMIDVKVNKFPGKSCLIRCSEGSTILSVLQACVNDVEGIDPNSDIRLNQKKIINFKSRISKGDQLQHITICQKPMSI